MGHPAHDRGEGSGQSRQAFSSAFPRQLETLTAPRRGSTLEGGGCVGGRGQHWGVGIGDARSRGGAGARCARARARLGHARAGDGTPRRAGRGARTSRGVSAGPRGAERRGCSGAARGGGCRPDRRPARGLHRRAPALPQGHRPRSAPDRRPGGRACEAHRARRHDGEAEDGRVEPPPGRLDREELPQPGAPVPRSDPGGDDRPRARRGEVRLPEGLQVLHLRDLVDSPGRRPRAGRQGAHDPHALSTWSRS